MTDLNAILNWFKSAIYIFYYDVYLFNVNSYYHKFYYRQMDNNKSIRTYIYVHNQNNPTSPISPHKYTNANNN